ncbi:MAG: hypothetical protein K6B72_06905 [Lachnospiraceae bacterium]|nr:hypothetical protein [Lachnospiraceae bacterium]
MNGNDLMNALSGIDPKYIDEAAFELHESPAPKKTSKIVRINRFALIAIPAAAALLLTVSVVLTRMHVGKSESTSAGTAMTDAAYPAPEAASEAAYDADSEAAFDAASEADYDMASEAAGEDMMDMAPGLEAPEASKGDNAAAAEASTSDATGSSAASAASETSGSDSTLSADFEEAELNDSERSYESKKGLTSPILEEAEYEDGILTVTVKEALPPSAKELKYSITAADGSGSDTPLAEGTLGDILLAPDPLTLDLTDLDLPAGTYTLTLGTSTISFTCK